METAISLNQIGLYNPQRQNDEVTEKLFVVRQKQFESLLNSIIQENENSIPQHHLILGQRGMGKTSILKRLEVELNKDQYRQRFIPLLLPEGQNNLSSIAELWLNNLTVLVKSLKSGNYPAEKLADIIKTKEELSGKTPEIISEEGYKYLLSICRELHRRPVLLIDNIGWVFSNLENKQEQWVMRKLLSENGAPIIVSAGITATDDIINYGMAFYDFFQIQYLKKLSYEEFEKLLKNLATVTHSDEMVFTSIREHSPRQKSLFYLTGGSPRTTVMLFKHIVRGFSSDINDDLEILADEVTPLYEARFRELPKQQRTIIDAIAMYWDAISLNKLSKITRFTGSQLSPQLKRLADEGWIETVVADKKSRKVKKETEGIIKGNAYFISERFFNIWYLLRYDIMKEGIYCLSKFLEYFYGKEELEKMSDNLPEQGISSARQMQVYLAMSEMEIFDPHKREQIKANINKALLKKILALDIDELIELTAKINPEDAKFWRNIGFLLWEKEQYEKAIICYDKVVKLEPKNSFAWSNKSRVLIDLQRYEEVIDCCDRAIELVPKNSFAWTNKGYTLNNLQRYDEAIDCYDKVTELDPENSPAWNNKGLTLTDLQRYDEAIDCFNKATKLDTKNSFAWTNKGYALINLQRYDEAIDCFDKAIELEPKNSFAWSNKGYVLTNLKKYLPAVEAYEQSIKINPKELISKFHLIFLYRDKLDKKNKAIEIFNEIEKEIHNDKNKKFVPRYYLNKTLFELHEKNQGLAKEHLLQAFEVLEKEGKIASMANETCWLRFGSVVIGLEYCPWLLAILEEKGYDAVLSPYYTALQALEIEMQDSKNGKEDAEIYLKNRAIEISEPARKIIVKMRNYL